MRETNQELKAEDLGARVRAVRELAGAHQREVAKAAGMSRRELQAAERGAKRLSTAELRAVAGALGVDPDVFVGVGYDGDLVRAGSIDDRIDEVVGHDPDHWDDLPASVDDLPPALPVNLPNPERRKDFVTRERIERSWRDVRNEMGDALTSCARLVSAGSGDDVRRLIERLERDLTALKAKRTFQRNLADHERALERARATGVSRPVSPALAAGEAR
ncbi:MAG TPA: helix-turn-helix transcriptional regulator [Acidimicrobiia bacterium]|nr:helix-turn-helix transcriptional regulator [Acidimicrobiia bacterium]